MASDLLRREFRLNPSYTLVPLQALSADERALLGHELDDTLFGIARPDATSSLRTKSICRATADLVARLAPAGPLPPDVVDALGASAHDEIAGLVLEDVLEVRVDEGFVSGARAHRLVASPAACEEGSRTARLSLAALWYGVRLPIDDPRLLSAQMYFYNRRPVTTRWARRCGTPDRFARFLMLDQGGPCARLLARWHALPRTPETRGWQSWALRRPDGPPLHHKLYVSPALEAVPEALPHVIEVFGDQGVSKFKMGADLPGIARPDKIVAYLPDLASVSRVAERLAERLLGCPSQGVPFTAELAGEGLLSWGLDPVDTLTLDAQERTSWRLWITHRAAAALLDARRLHDRSIMPFQYALDRLQHDGIDTRTWTPLEHFRGRAR